MLPTFLFILGAYALYATVRFWSRRSSRRGLGSRESRVQRLAMAAGLAAVALAVWLGARGGADPQDRNLRLASILGTSWVGVGVPAQTEYPLEQASPKILGPEGQPTFALLHPETPPSLILPEKAASPLKAGQPQAKRRPGPLPQKRAKAAKAVAKEKTPVKEKGGVKGRPKPRKPAAVAAKPGLQVQAAAR